MNIKVAFAELHGPLFLGGKNHGLKLFNKAGLDMEYDKEEKELIVKYGGKIQFIPSSNLVTYEPLTDAHVKADPAPPVAPQVRIKAQASTPHDHVFAQAPGKTRS